MRVSPFLTYRWRWPSANASAVRFRASIGTEATVAALLVVAAAAFNLFTLYPEIAVRAPLLNDGVVHALAVEHVASSISAGRDPTDSWFPYVLMGFPLFHYYQHLAYLPPGFIRFLSGHSLSGADLVVATQYVLLAVFPLAIYWSTRLFGFDRLQAACSGLVASLISTNGLYGMEFGSYVWRGFGMYAQAWGMVLLPLAVACGYRVLRDGRGYVWAVPLLAATLLCHLVSGYIAFLSLAPLALLSSSSESPDAPTFGALARRISRLVLLAGLAILTCSYFIVPLLLHVEFLNRGVWNDPRWYDSFGHERVLSMLVTGELFDFGRSPSLTVLVAIGLVCCVWHWRQERYRVPVALFVMWLLLYFGRPTWGVLLELLPMSHDMHFIRLSAGVHLAGIYLMGIALAEPWRWSWARRDARFVLAVIAVMLLLLYPV